MTLSDPGRLFRHELFDDYKSNRKANRKPIAWKAARRYVEEKMGGIWRPRLEADDVMGILATGHTTLAPHTADRVVCSVDKDMRQVPGLHFDWTKDEEVREVSLLDADAFFFQQVLSGDPTDGIPGLPGVGPKTAEKMIAAALSEHETMWEAVVSTYEKRGFDEEHALLHEMADDLKTLGRKNLSMRRIHEIYHDATFDKERAQQLFNTGVLTLKERAIAEQFSLCALNAVAKVVNGKRDKFEDIVRDLDAALVDRYFANFSLFQSLPDNWAIDQLFPIMPIHRLDEEPTRRGTIQDVTCDSDGKIDRFIGGRDGQPSLPLHVFRDGDAYYLGIFLTGAYQEILGDLHNLFGDTNAVHIRLRGDAYEVTHLVHGDTVTEVLDYVEFRASDLLATFRRKVQNAKGLSREDANMFIAEYVAGLEGYTYLEGEAAR
jgi:hypothetical protein